MVGNVACNNNVSLFTTVCPVPVVVHSRSLELRFLSVTLLWDRLEYLYCSLLLGCLATSQTFSFFIKVCFLECVENERESNKPFS